jgi:hypothetical protein
MLVYSIKRVEGSVCVPLLDVPSTISAVEPVEVCYDPGPVAVGSHRVNVSLGLGPQRAVAKISAHLPVTTRGWRGAHADLWVLARPHKPDSR